MKFFIVLIALAAISLSVTEAHRACSQSDYKPTSFYPLLGTWITYKTYNNGPEVDYKCSFYEMAKTDHLNMVWRSQIWKDNSKSCTKGYFIYSDPGLLLTSWTDNVEEPLTMVSTNYRDYFILRSCSSSGEEYVWIMARSVNPSKEILQLIDEAIIEVGLDKSKLHRTCIGFKDSELVSYL